MSKLDVLKKSLYGSIEQLESLQEEALCGMIDNQTAKAKVEILRKEIKEKKLRVIEEVHRGKRGNLLSMGSYNEKRGLYFVKCADGKIISAKDEDGLLDALMKHYGLSLDSPLVKDVYARAIARYEQKHPNKDRTVVNFGYDFNRYVTEEFGQKDIRKVSRDFLECYSLELVSHKIKKSSLTAYKTLLNLIYNQAIYEGLLNQNLAKEISIKELACYCDQSLSHRKPADLLYSESEDEAMNKYMRNRIEEKFYDPYAFMALFQKEFGIRPDEDICLKWSDFDLEQGLISVERQQIEHRKPKRWFEVVDYLKNEKGESVGGRVIPLSTNAIHLYHELKAIKEKEGIESEWLFTKKDGTLLRKSDYSDFLLDACKALGIKSKGSYAFRRAFNSKMEKNGIPASERALIMGHSIPTNLNNYSFGQVDYLDRVRLALE